MAIDAQRESLRETSVVPSKRKRYHEDPESPPRPSKKQRREEARPSPAEPPTFRLAALRRRLDAKDPERRSTTDWIEYRKISLEILHPLYPNTELPTMIS